MDEGTYRLGEILIGIVFVYMLLLVKYLEKTKFYHHIVPYAMCYVGIAIIDRNILIWREEKGLISFGIISLVYLVVHFLYFLQIKYESSNSDN